MQIQKFICYLGLATAITGCRSFSSTPLTRFDNDTFTGDSNGEQRLFCNARPHKGLPVKVKITTHYDVFIKETYCVQQEDLTADSDKSRVIQRSISEPLASTRLLEVDTVPIQSEQIIIVDFKRPGSGSLDLETTFTNDQYFKKITSKIQDNTITDTAALIKSITKLVGTPRSAGLIDISNDPSPKRKWAVRTVAYQRFDINDPGYEMKMEEFVNHHLNACNDCSQANYEQQAPQ